MCTPLDLARMSNACFLAPLFPAKFVATYLKLSILLLLWGSRMNKLTSYVEPIGPQLRVKCTARCSGGAPGARLYVPSTACTCAVPYAWTT